MDTKLTLKLDSLVIEKAKEYASVNKQSLSRIIESYLQSLINQKQSIPGADFEISPFVRSMSSGVQIPNDIDFKTQYSNRLEEKYS